MNRAIFLTHVAFNCPQCGDFSSAWEHELSLAEKLLDAKAQECDVFLTLCPTILEKRVSYQDVYLIKIRKPTELVKELDEK